MTKEEEKESGALEEGGEWVKDKVTKGGSWVKDKLDKGVSSVKGALDVDEPKKEKKTVKKASQRNPSGKSKSEKDKDQDSS